MRCTRKDETRVTDRIRYSQPVRKLQSAACGCISRAARRDRTRDNGYEEAELDEIGPYSRKVGKTFLDLEVNLAKVHH